MKEKLLALLIAKFAGVSEATLERIATKKAGSVTDESQLQSVVDGIDFGFVVQSEVDSKVTDSNKKAIQNYEATHKLKDGKPVAEPTAPGTPPATEVPEWAKGIIESNNALKQKLETYEKKETQVILAKRVTDKLYEGKDEKQKFVLDMMLSNGVSIESEDQIDQVVGQYTEKFNQQYQKAVDAGVVIDVPVSGSPGSNDTKSIVSQIEAGTKQIVEQSKK